MAKMNNTAINIGNMTCERITARQLAQRTSPDKYSHGVSVRATAAAESGSGNEKALAGDPK